MFVFFILSVCHYVENFIELDTENMSHSLNHPLSDTKTCTCIF